MPIDLALEILHVNIAVIGNAARLQNEIALEVASAYAQYGANPGIITEELLINAVERWNEYQRNNPHSEV